MKEIDKNKLGLSVAIVLGCLILGGFFYAIQINKQKSIEKQEQIKLIQEQENNCQKLAVQQKNDLLKENPDNSFFSFEYHYNSNTKMCILAYVENDNSLIAFFRNYRIVNLFTGEEIYNKNGYEQGDAAIKLNKELNSTAELYFNQKSI